jgi:hypothetical protein
VRINSNICAYKVIRRYIYANKVICTYIHTCVRIKSYVHMYVRIKSYVHMYVRIKSYVHMYVRIKSYVHMYVRIMSYVHMYVRIMSFMCTFCSSYSKLGKKGLFLLTRFRRSHLRVPGSENERIKSPGHVFKGQNRLRIKTADLSDQKNAAHMDLPTYRPGLPDDIFPNKQFG